MLNPKNEKKMWFIINSNVGRFAYTKERNRLDVQKL